jgi:transglutaminase-like putative cysteine protease
MTRIEHHIALQYQVGPQGADLIFNIHAAHTAHQTVSQERLQINQAVVPQLYTDPATGTRFMRLRALPGPLLLQHSAVVDLRHHRMKPAEVAEVPVAQLPFETLGYLNPSRYAQSDQFAQLAMREFGLLPQGYGRVQAVQTWVQSHVRFTANTSNSNTSAVETLQSGQGVCRDFAHLMIALCRALCIPARFTTGTDWGADPALGPPDFHAYVEVYLSGGWYIFVPSGTAIPMGFVRLGTGRDAADVPFASMYGEVTAQAPVILTKAVANASQGIGLPAHCTDALSTDASLPVGARA